MRNPPGEFIMALTDFLVLRARRFIPPIQGYDTASLLPAIVIEAIYLAALLWTKGFPFAVFPFAGIIALTAVRMLELSIYLLMGALVIQAVLSWINPHSQASGLLNAVTFRFLAPFRRIIPPLGNVDLTVLVLFIVCQLLLKVPIVWLNGMAMRLF